MEYCNSKDDISRIIGTVSLCRRVANSIRKCSRCDVDHITAKAAILKQGLRERKQADLNKLTQSMSAIDFNNFHTCCAYMVTYAACNSELTYIAATIFLTIRKELKKIVDARGALTITSVNGGPGNDLLGVLYSLCEKYSNLKELYLNIIDPNVQWQVFFSTLMSEVESNGKCNRLGKFVSEIKLLHKFVHADVMQSSRFGVVKDTLENSDMVIMVRTMSLMTQKKKIEFLQDVFDRMKKNSVLLIVDTEKPSSVVSNAKLRSKVIMDMNDIVACTKSSTVYNCRNITVCVADAIALRKK